MTTTTDSERRCRIYTAAVNDWTAALLAERQVKATYDKHRRAIWDLQDERDKTTGTLRALTADHFGRDASRLTAALYADDVAVANLRAARAEDAANADHRAYRIDNAEDATRAAWAAVKSLRITHGIHVGESADACDRSSE